MKMSAYIYDISCKHVQKNVFKHFSGLHSLKNYQVGTENIVCKQNVWSKIQINLEEI